MVAIAKGSSSNATTPILDVWTPSPDDLVDGAGVPIPAGALIDPYAASFAIFDVTTDQKRTIPVQVFPAPSGVHAVDLTADRLGLGHYVAAWTAGSGLASGRYEIRWSITLLQGDAPRLFRREFDVLDGVVGFGQRGYALVSDFRAEGISIETASDARLQEEIEDQSRFIERVTRRFFEPRAANLRADGNNSRCLDLRMPIIGIESVNTIDSSNSPNDRDLGSFKIYSRHLSQNLTDPDDRSSPRIEFVQVQPLLIGQAASYYPAAQFVSGYWPRGTQNVRVIGVFGYTDADGSLSGWTPRLIRKVTKLLVLRNLPKLGDVEGRFDAQQRHRLTQERTREQSYQLAAGKAGEGQFTSDFEIDSILEQFCAPMQIAST